MEKNKISCRQLRRMIFVEGFGAAGLTFPAVAAWESRSEGMLPVVLYVLLQFVFVGWLLYLTERLEKKSPKAMETGYGCVIGKGLGVIYLIRLFLSGLALFYFFGLSVQQIYMPRVSLPAIWLPFGLLLWYCAQTTLQKRARFVELLFPWIAVLVALLLLAAFVGVGAQWHSPAFKETMPVLFRNSYLLLLCSSPLEFLLFLVPAAVPHLWGEEKKGAGWIQRRRRQVWLAVGAVVLCNLLLWLATVEKLGGALTVSSPWPVAKVMQLIHFPGGFLERVDLLLVMFWIFCMAGVLSGYLYYGRKLGEEVFGISCGDERKRRKTAGRLTAAAVVLCFLLCCVIQKEGEEPLLSLFLWYKKWIDFPLLVLLPLLALTQKKTIKRAAAAMLFLLCLPLWGCQQEGDVEEKSYVLSLYVEKAGEDYVYWVSTADLSEMSDKEQKIPCNTIHFRAKNMEEMEKKYRKTEAGELEWNHMETIFLGPVLAEDEKRTEEFLREWEASWQKSPDVLLTVCLQGADRLWDVKNIPAGAAGQEISRLAEQREQASPRSEKAGRYCRTPMEVLKAMDEGEKNIYVRGTKVQWERLVLLDACYLRGEQQPAKN